MEHERYKRKTDYTKPDPRRQAPVLDELGELRVPDAAPAAVETPIATNNAPVETLPTPKAEAVAPLEPVAPVAPKLPAAQSGKNPENGVAPVTISVNISMPKVKLHKPKLPKISPSRLKLALLRFGKWPLIGAGAVLLLLIGFLVFKHFHHPVLPVADAGQGQADAAAALSQPSFTPVEPSNKVKSAFDGTKDSFSFTDYLDGTALTVSEQPLPKQFSSASQALTTVARSIGATSVLPTSSLNAYLNTDTKNKVQTVVFSKSDLLIFIQSYFQHSNAVWEQYIDSLH